MVPECHGWVFLQAAHGEGPSACTNRAIFHWHIRTWDCPGRLCKKWGSTAGEKPITNTTLPPTKRPESRGGLWQRRAGTSTEQQRMSVSSSLCLLSSITNLATIKRDCEHGMNPSLGPTRHFSLENFLNKVCYFFVQTFKKYLFWLFFLEKRKAKKTQSFPKMKHFYNMRKFCFHSFWMFWTFLFSNMKYIW